MYRERTLGRRASKSSVESAGEDVRAGRQSRGNIEVSTAETPAIRRCIVARLDAARVLFYMLSFLVESRLLTP